ncbi:MAG: flagellin [Hyphomicrobiales bacterium]
MSDINLSSAVRTSLTSLQSTADLLSSTQERLATGNRVNSALDDPTAFFTASALNNRASDLGTLLDAQQQAIRTVEAADQGITAIEDLVDSARAQATAALQTEDPAARAEAAAAFDEIVGQIEDLAGDASFNGTNLLAGDDLQVVFNESGDASLTVEGFDLTNAVTNLGLQEQTAGESIVTAGVDAEFDTANLTVAGGDTIQLSDGTTDLGEITVTAAAAVATEAEITTAIGAAITAFEAENGAGSSTISVASGVVESAEGDIEVAQRGSATVNTSSADGGAGDTAFVQEVVTGGSFASDSAINAALAQIDSALGTLRSSAASLGSDLSTIQIRQDFTSNLINTLEAGAGDLTLADLNEEGANLLTLQTRQQLASTSLSFATQSDSSVLSLF